MRKVTLASILTMLLLLLTLTAMAEPAALDLSGHSFEDLAELTELLDQQEKTGTIVLDGGALSVAERRELLARYPEMHFVWTMDLWGVTVSSEDTSVTFEGKEAVSLYDLCDLLACMPGLKKVDMWDKQVNRKEMDALLAFPEVEVGMTIKLNKSHILRTDMTAYSTLGRQPQITRSDTHYFTFLKDLKALDVGHMFIQSLDFLEECSKLKILIAADCSLKDISPIACQTDLEYVELFKNYITDISPLAELTNLRDLNIGYCQITDLSPLYDLPNLERVWLMGNWYLPDEEVERLREHQPDCEIVTFSYGATGNLMTPDKKQIPGTSWRHHKHYDTIYWIFHNNEYIGWDVEVPQIKTVNDP